MANKKYSKKRKKDTNWRIPIAAIIVFLIALLMQFVPEFESSINTFLGIEKVNVTAAQQIDTATKVHVIDVGQGSATLLEQNGEYVLIDAGPPEGKENLLGYLHALDVKTLKYMIMTHPHADHIAAMPDILEEFTIENLILPDFTLAPTPTTSTFEKVLLTATQQQIPTQTAKVGDIYPIGNGTINVLQAGIETNDNYNLLSVITMFEADDLRVLITGDAEKSNEKALLATGKDIKANVYIAGHHGSSTSNTADFVQAINPEIVAISCGVDNSYGHPHKKPLENFESIGAVILRTDLSGNIVIGKSITSDLEYSQTGK